MQIFKVRNVNEAYPFILKYMTLHGKREDSRNGKVLVAPTPVMTVYRKPYEKVLFNAVRDANPFFHLLEAMWMLSGCNDVEFLNYYVRDFGERYGDDGVIHGAYGHRWREAFGFDQLDFIIQKFRKDLNDRQCVLQMWDCSEYSDDLRGNWADRCCNTQVYFRVNQGKLDITTTARSHDALWGALGANCVHFPIMQEYVAAMIDVPVGKFYQFSNNYHVYLAPLQKLLEKGSLTSPEKVHVSAKTLHMVTDIKSFDEELQHLMTIVRKLQSSNQQHNSRTFNNPFLYNTVFGMAIVYSVFRTKGANIAFELLNSSNIVEAQDWRIAAFHWLKRRIK